MIDISPEHLETIKGILREHAPDCEVRAFGSRVTGKAKKHSDLDLCIVCAEKLSLRKMGVLAEAFEESTLPFRVDVIDWNAISESFRAVVDTRYEVLSLQRTSQPAQLFVKESPP